MEIINFEKLDFSIDLIDTIKDYLDSTFQKLFSSLVTKYLVL